MKLEKLLLLVVLLLPVTLVQAQTGKISGSVVDQNQEPLPGVNVVIDGTTTGTVTDNDGFYAILNVRPGTYRLRATFIGFTPAVVENVAVSTGLTTEVNIILQEAAVGLDEVVVTAGRPIIQRDIAASERSMDAEEITSGRFQSVNNVLVSQVGVNDVSSVENRPEIRGSGFDESLFLVDGVTQGDPLTNQPYYNVNLDAVEEVKVQTGGFSAEYGNVRSGVINVVTKEGGERYSGSVNLQYSPAAYKHFGPGVFDFDSPLVVPFVQSSMGAFSGNDFFGGWDAVAQDEGQAGPHLGNPMELYARYLWRHRSQDAIDELKNLADQGIVQFADGVNPDDMVWQQTGVKPDYRISATLGGPIPGINAVKFFLSYDGTQSEYAYRFPEPVYTDNNFRGKLTTNMGKGMKLNVHGFYSKQKGGEGGQGPGIGGFVSSNPFTSVGSENKFWYPHCGVPGNRTRQVYGAQWTHAISANTFYQFNITHDRVDYEMEMQFRNTAPIPGALSTAGLPVPSSSAPSGSGVDNGRIGTTAEAEARAAAGQQGWERWREWAMIRIGQHWYDEAPKGYGPVNWRDVTGEYRMESCNLRADETSTRGWDVSGGITSQLGQHNQVKVGFEMRRDDINQYYEAIDPSVNGGSVWDSNVDQIRGGIYLQDKLEFRGFVANLGVRFDFLQTGEFPITLDCDLTNPADCAGDDGPYSQYLTAGNTTADIEGGRVLGIKETVIGDNIGTDRKTHARVSPRIGLSHPITSVAKIFFNYGHFYQWPNAQQLYTLRLDTPRGYILANGDSWGNPLLEPERTIQYEVGYEQNLFDKMNLRLTGYFKDINNEVADVEIFPLSYGGRDYETWQNMGFRDVRGLETFLELRRDVMPYFSGWISANYLVESGAEYGFDRFYEDPSRQSRLADTEVSNPDVRPIMKGSINFNTPDNFIGPMLGDVSLLGGLNINVLYTWQRGRQFTWNPASFPLVEDNLRWKAYQRWDLRLTKSLFRRGPYEAQFYVDVTNMFNNRNMTVFNGLSSDDSNITDEAWAWDGHRWWNNERRDYMESLGYSPANQNEDGSFNGTSGKPGDWKDDNIDLPAFSPFTFLERRDIYFGVKLYF